MAPVATTEGYGGHYLPDDSSKGTAFDAKTPVINNPSDEDVTIHDQLYGTRKKMRVVMLGAGVSGLNFFKFAEEKLKNVEIICYEKNDDVGGTWYESKYLHWRNTVRFKHESFALSQCSPTQISDDY